MRCKDILSSHFTSLFPFEETSPIGIQEFVNKLKIEEAESHGGFIFRGQASNAWTLAPKLFRSSTGELLQDDQRKEALRIYMSETLPKFKDIYMDYFNDYSYQAVPTSNENGDKFVSKALYWHEVAQHYGLPTPMLDWTYSPFVAIFMMAIGKTSGCSVGRLYCLDMNEVNYSKLHLHEWRVGNKLNLRMKVQKGMFSIPKARSPSPPRTTSFGTNTLEEDLAIGDHNENAIGVIDFILDDSEVRKISHLCNLMGISRTSMFPDSFSERVKELLESN